MFVRLNKGFRLASTGVAGVATAALCANAARAAPAPAKAGTTTPIAAAAAPIVPVGQVSGSLALQNDFDVVVVGGGIVGLATAREVLKRFPHKTVAVLEKEKEVGPHQSSHNSGVIHAGIYYEPGSVMAATCVRGAALMYEFCASHGVPYDRCGKLIVASTAAEDKVVQELYRRASLNGVQGLRVLNPDEIRAMEPNVVGTSALWSPNTGIADYGVACKALAQEIVNTKHADVKLQFQVEAADVLADGRVRVTGREPGQPGPTKTVTARNVITCGGFYSDRLSALFGGARDPRIVTFRGTYWQMKPQYRNIVSTNIYPVPSGGGIPVGVHFTPTVNERRGHQVIVGPGACVAFSREGYKMSNISLCDLWDYALNGGLWKFALSNPRLSLGELWKDVNKTAFMKEARKLCPSVTDDMVEESFTGVMAQVFEADGKAAKDFVFERRVLGGTTLNVRNAPSPAATSSLAIAEHVVNIAQEDFGWTDAAGTSIAAAAAPSSPAATAAAAAAKK